MKFTHAALALSISTLGLGGASIAQDNSDTVDVSMTVSIARAIELTFDGNVSLADQQSITDFDGNIFTGVTGLTTGCVHLTGADRVSIAISGLNPGPGGEGPYLRHTDTNNGQDYFVNYDPIFAIAPPGTDFSGIFQQQVGGGGDGTVQTLYRSFDPSSGFPLNSNTAEALLLGGVGGSTESGCASGSNIAFGAVVGVELNSIGHEPPFDGNGRKEFFRNLEALSGGSDLAEGDYTFSDTVTVTLTPLL